MSLNTQIPSAVQPKDGLNEGKPNFSLREIMVKYLSYFPLFVLSLVIFLGSALMYIRYKVPIYRASVQVLVNNPLSNQAQPDLISQAVSGVRSINLENEMQLIRSKEILERVVKKGNYNITYAKEGNIKTFDAYTAAPFTFIPLKVADSGRIFQIKLVSIDNVGGKIELPKGKIDFKWNDSLNINQFAFRLMKNGTSIEQSSDPYIVKWKPTSYAASELQGRISISTLSTKTSILILSIIGENRRKGEDILNHLVQEIISSDIELKKEMSIEYHQFY
ncbi:MAG: Wzz/FepE/Etk N-terminal domain-containing protein [Chitinophagaceae bacterium]